MPQTCLNIGPKLAITLDGDRNYRPGDPITGYVTRDAPITSPHATVTVKLFGRTKVKLTVPEGIYNAANQTTLTSTQSHRSRFSLFETASYKLFTGSLSNTPADAPLQWAFAIDIPRTVAPTADHKPCYSFISLKPEEAAGLPCTFHYQSAHNTLECFVEYVIEASLECQEGKGTTKTVAYLPVTVLPEKASPIVDFDLKSTDLPGFIRSQRLFPGMAEARLSVTQQMAKLVGAPGVPKLSFCLHIDCPRVIQLGSPFPFCASVSLDSAFSSEGLAKGEHEFGLTKLHLKLKAHSEVVCAGGYRNPTTSGLQLHEFTLRWKDALSIPVEDGDTVLDLGRSMNICIHPQKLTYNGGSQTWKTPVYPSFTTYNIKHSYTLEWKITIEVAGESFDFEGGQPVLVARSTV